MAIENRDLSPGTKLVATYKKETFVCEVVQTEEGLRYRVEGKDHKSPSAAGSAVMGGQACNGWRFWSLEGEAPAPRGRKSAETEGQDQGDGTPAEVGQPAGRKGKVIRKAANQKGVPEGQTRWYCCACAKSFYGTAEAPAVCPEGHRAETDPNGDLQRVDPTGEAEGQQAGSAAPEGEGTGEAALPEEGATTE